MRRFLPQTLPAWILFILIGGLLVSQIATFAIVSYDRAAANQVLELYRLDERAFLVVKLLATAKTENERKQMAAALSNSSYALTISENPVVASPIASDDLLAELEDVMTGRLAKFGVIDARVRHDPASSPGTISRNSTGNPDAGDVEHDLLSLAASFAESEKLTASIQLADGTWLNFTTPVTPLEPILSKESLPLYATVAVLVVAMTVWSIYRLTAPYRLMERAVKRIGGDLKSPPVSERGSREYRAAAKAVNSMQAKLREYVEDREQLAAALAHDLRTPLTRMRLRMEKLRKSPLRSALMNDISEIESIARSVVDFATLEVTDEEPERIDVGSLVYSIADGYNGVSFDGDLPRARSMICNARPVALRRCITNLLDNAVAYGKKVHLSLTGSDDYIVLAILDEGPGIPEEQLDAVFRPFVRVDKSRNRRTGGLGLGLTIARNIARDLGGEIRLSNDPNGGLRAELWLPRALI